MHFTYFCHTYYIMKKSLCILWVLLFAVSSIIFAQSDTLYISDTGILTTKEKATGYRVVYKTDSNQFLIREYPFSKPLRKEYYATTAAANILEGPYTEYDAEGRVILKGHYHKGFKTGKWAYYYSESALLKEIQDYITENAYQCIQYDSMFHKMVCKGAIDKFGKQNGEWIQYHENSDSIQTIFNYLNGKKEGLQLEFYANGKLKRREVFRNHKVLKGELFDENGSKQKYYPAFVYPRYREYVSNYLQKKVPCVAEALKRDGFHISLRISKNGEVIEASVSGVEEGLCMEKIRTALLKMKKWKPALWENRPISFTYKTTVKRYLPKD